MTRSFQSLTNHLSLYAYINYSSESIHIWIHAVISKFHKENYSIFKYEQICSEEGLITVINLIINKLMYHVRVYNSYLVLLIL